MKLELVEGLNVESGKEIVALCLVEKNQVVTVLATLLVTDSSLLCEGGI